MAALTCSSARTTASAPRSRGAFLADLTGKIDDVLGNTTEVSVAGSKVDGKVYMVPESLKAVAMYYDSEKVKTPPTTTDELHAVRQGRRQGRHHRRGEYFGYGWYAAFGGKIFDETGKCAATATTGVADALQVRHRPQDRRRPRATPTTARSTTRSRPATSTSSSTATGPWATTGRSSGRRRGPRAGRSGRSCPDDDRCRRLVHQRRRRQNQDLAIALRATELVRPELADQVFVDKAGHVPANTGITIIDPLTQALRRRDRHGLSRARRSSELDNFWGNFGNAWTARSSTAGADPIDGRRRRPAPRWTRRTACNARRPQRRRGCRPGRAADRPRTLTRGCTDDDRERSLRPWTSGATGTRVGRRSAARRGRPTSTWCPALIVMAVITLYPLIYQVWMSFTDLQLRNLRAARPRRPGSALQNYIDVLQSNLASRTSTSCG